MGVIGITPKGYYKIGYDEDASTLAQFPQIQQWAQALFNESTPSGSNALDADFDIMQSWFPGVVLSRFFPIIIHLGVAAGATWGPNLAASGVLVQASSNTWVSRFLIVAEMSEVFMRDQGLGWYAGSTDPGHGVSHGNEGDNGEGLSRFLARQILVLNGQTIASLLPVLSGGTGNQWLILIDRPNFVSDAGSPITDISESKGPLPAGDLGCTTLFVNYLHAQLGFSIQQIVAAGAPNLQGVYQNLTGDNGDPFPTFSNLLEHAFPGGSVVDDIKQDEDSPFPISYMQFVVLKPSYGKDEVTTWIQDPNHQGVYNDKIYLEVHGLNRNQMGADLPTLDGDALNFNNPSTTPFVSFDSTSNIQFQNPNNVFMPQIIRYPYNVNFTSQSLNNFPSADDGGPLGPLGPFRFKLSATLPGPKFNSIIEASCDLSFFRAENPYFANVTDITPPGSLPTTTDLNPFYFSQDLRVFTATPTIGANPNNPNPAMPVRGSTIHGLLPPEFPANEADIGGAYTYIQKLLTYMNTEYFNPDAVDPFVEVNDVVPTQFYVYSQDASVNPYTYGAGVRWPNFNFAIARVRLQGPPGKQASNVRVFFRAWGTTTADTGYDPNVTYRRITDSAGVPVFPQPAVDLHTVPFFATGNSPNSSDPNNAEYGPDGIGINTHTMRTDGTPANSRWYYFGCFLNFFDPSFQFQKVGTHHCLVAEIAYADTPIQAINNVAPTPETSDKLAQRNMSVTFAENPGPATKLIPQVFDLKPSAPVSGTNLTADDLRPDCMMIEWNNVPPNSTFRIYWPAINAVDVISLANRFFTGGSLSIVDAHTVQLPTTRTFGYIPIPPSAGENFAGLITLDLPMTIHDGQKYLVTLRRLTGMTGQDATTAKIAFAPNRQTATEPKNGGVSRTSKPALTSAASAAIHSNITSSTATATASATPPSVFAPATPLTNPVFPPVPDPHTYHYRLEVGSFALNIPVTSAQNIVHTEIDTLAIMKDRLAHLSASDRWSVLAS